MQIFIFEREILPIINILRDSKIYSQRVELVVERYLSAEEAARLLTDSLKDVIPSEFIKWSYDFILDCVLMSVEVALNDTLTKKESRAAHKFNKKHEQLLGYQVGL